MSMPPCEVAENGPSITLCEWLNRNTCKAAAWHRDISQWYSQSLYNAVQATQACLYWCDHKQPHLHAVIQYQTLIYNHDITKFNSHRSEVRAAKQTGTHREAWPDVLHDGHEGVLHHAKQVALQALADGGLAAGEHHAAQLGG